MMTRPEMDETGLQLTDYLAGAMDAAERAAFEQRLASDESLKKEYDALSAIWALTGSLKTSMPTPRMPESLSRLIHGTIGPGSVSRRLDPDELDHLAAAGAPPPIDPDTP